jgi:hypothetical protein
MTGESLVWFLCFGPGRLMREPLGVAADSLDGRIGFVVPSNSLGEDGRDSLAPGVNCAEDPPYYWW